MAEIKTGIFAKNVQKRLNRAQEKVGTEDDGGNGGMKVKRWRTDGRGKMERSWLEATGLCGVSLLSTITHIVLLLFQSDG